eukprot:218858-Pelagomonas_calceolata.AAC.1
MACIIDTELQSSCFTACFGTNSNTARRVVQADLKLQFKDDKCWSAQFIQAIKRLRNSGIFEQAVKSGGAISKNFSANLRYRL